MMTNSEAIKQLKERYDIGQKEYLNFAPKYIESLKMAMEALEENDKLKADIEQFSNELISILIENELLRKKNELKNYYFEQYAAAIDEIEQLKSEIEQWQSTNLKLACELTRIECENNQLKSELEQSDSCDGCKHELERNKYYCYGCKRILVDNFELKSEVSE